MRVKTVIYILCFLGLVSLLGCANISSEIDTFDTELKPLSWEQCVQGDLYELQELIYRRYLLLKDSIEDYSNNLISFEQYAERRLILDFDLIMLKVIITEKTSWKEIFYFEIEEIKSYEIFQI